MKAVLSLLALALIHGSAPAAGVPVSGEGGAFEYFGVAYYPEAWPESRWPEDLRMMKELGINLLRIGEFNWGRFEPSEGVFDFAQFKRFCRLCEKEGLKILMCTPTAATPRWMVADYPETEKLRKDGTRPPNGLRQTSCQTSKKFRFFADRIVTKMAEAFRDEPAVVMWQLDNELSTRAATGECVCDECQRGFREFLKRKYGTLEKLNKEWNGCFWSADFRKWEDIRAPLQIPHRRGWQFDLDLFHSEEMESLIHGHKEILLGANPGWRLTTNNPSYGEGQRLDRVFRDLGYVSADRYCSPANCLLNRWMASCYRALTGRDQRYMIGETGAWGYDSTKADSYAPMRTWMWENIMLGAESYCYFRWRMSVAGEESHPAILPHNGRKGWVFDLIRKNLAELASLPESMPKLPLGDSPVAILYDPETSDMHRNDNWKYGAYLRIQSRIHDGCLRFGVVPKMVMKRGEEDFSPYRIVFAPMTEVVDAALNAKLRQFVENGGVLVAGPRLNLLEPLGHSYLDVMYPKDLADLFGVEVFEWRTLADNYAPKTAQLELPTGRFGGEDVVEYLRTLPGCEVVQPLTATCFKGAPLLTCNRYGKGAAYYLAADPDEEGGKNLVKYIFSRHGLAVDREWPASVLRVRRGDYVMITNMSAEEHLIPLETGRCLLGNARVRDGKMVIAPWDVLVILKTGTRASAPLGSESRGLENPRPEGVPRGRETGRLTPLP